MTNPSGARPLRSDAVRTQKLLREAAAAAFAEQGINVSIAHIAERAGIGKGTMFRHFATKEDLVAAIVCENAEGLATLGDGLKQSPDPGAALWEFVTAIVEAQVRDRAFCEIAAGFGHDQPTVRASTDRLNAVADTLTERARQQGAIRAGITGQDIMLLASGIFQTAAPLRSTHPELWRRYLRLAFDGLEVQGAPELPCPPPGNSTPTHPPDPTATDGEPAAV